MVSKKKKLKLYFDTLENTWTNYRAIFGFFWCLKYKVYEAPKILVEKTIVTKTSI